MSNKENAPFPAGFIWCDCLLLTYSNQIKKKAPKGGAKAEIP